MFRKNENMPVKTNKDETDTDSKKIAIQNKTSNNARHEDKDIQDFTNKMRMTTTLHTKSSFPNVLDQYTKTDKEEENEEKEDKKQKEKEEKKLNKLLRSKAKKKNKKTAVFYDSDEEKEKEKERDDEKYLQVLNDLEKLRTYYYNKYKRLLTEKVEKQRRSIRQQKEKSEIEAKNKEKSQKEANYKNQKRSEQHVLSHNDEYMKSIPKSDVYMIIGLQDQMVKQGKLKNQEDLDNFWNEMRKPEVFLSYFPANIDKNENSSEEGMSSLSGLATTTTSTTASKDLVTAFAPPPPLLHRPLSNIEETKESSRPTTQEEHWAVTQKFRHVHSPGNTSRRTFIAKQAATDLERKCPKLEMPPLHCFTMELGPKPPDPEEIRREEVIRIKEKNRRGFLKKLHKMHHLAMANGAAATRILDRHEYTTFIIEGPNLTDVIGKYYWEDHSLPDDILSIQQTSTPPRPVSRPSRAAPELPHIHQRIFSAPEHQETDECTSRMNQQDLRKHVLRKNFDSEKQVLPYIPPKPIPLSVDDIIQESKTVEAKCLSSNWTNYARAGKSVFLTL